MENKELITLFRKIRDEYAEVELGYSNREQLQYWRQKLVFIYSSLADRTSTISAAKIYQERRKDSVRSEEYDKIKSDEPGKSATAIKEEIGKTEAYKQWSTDFSKAYGRWEAFKDVQSAVKITIDSISSHLRNIQTADFLDAK